VYIFITVYGVTDVQDTAVAKAMTKNKVKKCSDEGLRMSPG